MKKSIRRISLARETLRALDGGLLGRAVAGETGMTSLCPPTLSCDASCPRPCSLVCPA
jgi:hypothetical protein